MGGGGRREGGRREAGKPLRGRGEEGRGGRSVGCRRVRRRTGRLRKAGRACTCKPGALPSMPLYRTPPRQAPAAGGAPCRLSETHRRRRSAARGPKGSLRVQASPKLSSLEQPASWFESRFEWFTDKRGPAHRAGRHDVSAPRIHRSFRKRRLCSLPEGLQACTLAVPPQVAKPLTSRIPPFHHSTSHLHPHHGRRAG